MTDVIVHTGKKGNTGAAGTDGVSVSQVRKSLISAPCLNLFRANNLDSGITWTRDDEASSVDRYGDYTVASGDNITQLLANSDNFDDNGAVLTHEWEDVNGIWTRDSDRIEPDPLGGSLASQITFTSTTGSTYGLMGNMLAGGGQIVRASIYVKVISGTLNKISFRNGASGTTVDFPQVPSSDWQRFDVVYTATGSQEARYLFDAPSGCVVHVFGANVTLGAKLYDYAQTVDARPVVTANPNPVYRENGKGYLIEGQKTNLCTDSINLSAWSTTGTPTISQNTNPDAFGNVNTPTLIEFTTSQSISIFKDIGVIDGVEYAVSFFAVAVSGEVESLTVSLGGAEAQTIDLTSGYTRQELIMTAGSNGRITFNAVTSASGTSFIISAVQVETGQHSSYIYTPNTTRTREADLVSISGDKLPALNSAFTIQCSYRDVNFISGATSTIFYTNGGFGLAGADNDSLAFYPKTGTSLTISGAQNDGDFIATFDGSGTLKCYLDGVLSATFNNVTMVDSEQSTLYLGATDASGSNALNASIKCLRMWDFEATVEEIKYIGESYNGNRFSDRG